MWILALVRAKNKKEAIEKSGKIFDDLSYQDGRRAFDYCTVIPEHVSKLTTNKGKKLYDTIWGYQVEEFNEAMDRIREAVKKLSNEELMEDIHYNSDESGWLFRHFCEKVGQHRGSAVRIYDQDGEGIRDEKHFKNVVEDWPTLQNRISRTDIPLWVIPADVHF